MSWIAGVGRTAFGRHEGRATLDLMSDAADLALADAGLARRDIDGLLTGYSTTLPHLMLSTLFAEHFGLSPRYAHAIQLGGATGFALVMLAHLLVESKAARTVLVVAGENRLSGQSRDESIKHLAQIGHARYEVPLGVTVPAYYALLASRYLHTRRVPPEDLAELAVLMRRHAALTPGAHLHAPVTVDDVLSSKLVASPLRLMDCCPISDGAAAIIVSAAPPAVTAVKIRGCGQAHLYQHVSAAGDLGETGAGMAFAQALQAAGIARADIGHLGIYDSFTITLALLLEELGFAPAGRAGAAARDGRFDIAGALPLNTHGGLLGYGHCGVGGALAHMVEVHLQLSGHAQGRQAKPVPFALLHGDGGVLSSHVSLILERVT